MCGFHPFNGWGLGSCKGGNVVGVEGSEVKRPCRGGGVRPYGDVFSYHVRNFARIAIIYTYE